MPRQRSCRLRAVQGVINVAAIFLASCTQLSVKRHPLAPLSGAEIREAVKILRDASQLHEGRTIYPLSLHEPPKDVILAGGRPPREVFAVIYDRKANPTIECVLNLDTRALLSSKAIAGVQPGLTGTDVREMIELVKSDARWRAGVQRRAPQRPDTLKIVAMPSGILSKDRIVKAIAYADPLNSPSYEQPVEGLVATVNLSRRAVLDVLDDGDGYVPPKSTRLIEERRVLQPLITSQPHGPEFVLADDEVRWQNWRFRFSMHPREGLVLRTVGFDDHGRARPVVYRAALSQMVVPYADPSSGWYFRNSFDVGELGMGSAAAPLLGRASIVRRTPRCSAP